MLHKGQRQAGRIAVMDADTYWEVVGMSLLDAEFLVQRRFSVEEICRWFGVPPQMIASQEKQTFASYEQAGLNFLGQAVLP